MGQGIHPIPGQNLPDRCYIALIAVNDEVQAQLIPESLCCKSVRLELQVTVLNFSGSWSASQSSGNAYAEMA